MPENLYPQLPTAPSMSQESFNIKTGNTTKTPGGHSIVKNTGGGLAR